MPRVARTLTPIQVRRLNKPGMHAVGGVAGLVLQVGRDESGRATASRCWILRTHIGGKRRSVGLGPYPEVSLKDARQKAAYLKEKVRQGIDPVAVRREARAALLGAQARRMTFEQAARAKYKAVEPTLKNKRSRDRWIRGLELYAFPILGSMEVADVELPHVLKVLQPIWQSKTETATRVRQSMDQTFIWSIVSKHRENPSPARWDGNLKEVLPSPKKIIKVQHQPALPWQDVPEFIRRLRCRIEKHGGMAARALHFAILTAARSGEVRHAGWPEIDLNKKLWAVPAERTKMGRPHNVPLSDEAVALLKSIPRLHECNLVFPNSKGNPLSDAVLSKITKDDPCVPHGFRSSFKTWAQHRCSMPDEVSELALAHVGSDATRAAYARDELLPQRTKMMQAWAKFCRDGEPQRASVSNIAEAQA